MRSAIAAALIGLAFAPLDAAAQRGRPEPSSCPPGTVPVPETDNCVPARGRPAAPFVGSSLLGTWRQTSSTGGACPTCSVTIGRAGRFLSIAANNGWSARLTAGQDGDDGRAVGDGRWSQGGGSFAGRPVSVEVNKTGSRTLELFLNIRGPGAITVRAAYAR